jgi:protein SCO1/2
MNPATKSLLVGVLLLAAVAGGWWLSNAAMPVRELQHATRLPQPLTLPQFSLVDAQGEAFGRQHLSGRWTMAFFGFTRCPDICPATLQMMSLARQRLADAGTGLPSPDILLVSVDPERDTPSVLQDYTAHFGPGVRGVTGPAAELAKLTTPLGIYFEREASNTDDYNIAHSPQVLIFDDKARFVGLFGAPHSVEAFVSDMPLLKAGQ